MNPEITGDVTGDFARTCQALLADGLRVTFRARGSSMTPSIRDGDLVIVEPTFRRPFERGSIVLYFSSGRLLAHRVLSTGDGLVTCQGDGWRCTRETLPEAAILGTVVAAGPTGHAPGRRRESVRWIGRLRATLGWGLRRLVPSRRRRTPARAAEAGRVARAAVPG